MARQILTNTDFNQNELQNARIQNLASAPGAPVNGQIYYDTTLLTFRYYNGSAWINTNGADIPDGTITSAKIADGAIMNIDVNASAGITYGKLALTGAILNADLAGSIAITKLANIATDRLLGRDTAAAGAVEELTVGGGIEFTGTGGVQRSALTGDVTAAAASGATTIANNAVTTIKILDANVTTAKILDANVTLAKLANIATDTLIGRDTAATGVPEAITVTGGIVFTGAGGIQTTAFTGDVTKALGGTALTIANSAVTNAKLANMAANSIKGNNTGGVAVALDLTAAQVKTLLAIVPGDVTGFDTQVRTSRLDQMAVPTTSVSMNNQLLTNVLEPVNPQDAATKNYVDLARQGIRMKESVVAATTAAITLSGTQSIDGVAVTATQRVLVKNQASTPANGIYLVNAGAWTRALDADTAAELADGATVWVSQGTTLANSTWSQTETLTTLGTDPQTWVQQGSATSYIGGDGLVLTGNTFDVVEGVGIDVTANAVSIDTAVTARKYNTTVGDGAAVFYVITHNFANQWCTVQVFRNSGAFDQVECDIELTSTNTVTLRFAVAPTSAQFRVVITG